MNHRITRRTFARAGAAVTLAVAGPQAKCISAATEAGPLPAKSLPVLDVRPYQLMCIVCRIGEGRGEDLGDARLSEILKAVRQDRKRPLSLRCNVDTVYRYQNPGQADDTPEGELFNAKRDLDIVQKLGLVPGDTRPAVDMLDRLLTNVPTARGICGYDAVTSETWRGCARAASGFYEKGRTLGIKVLLAPRDPQEKVRSKKASATAIYQAKTLRIRPHHLMCMSCFHGGAKKLSPIEEDNLFEAIDVIQKAPDIPVTLIAGCCMICPPCSSYDPQSDLCLGGRSMALRDQKKDLDVLQKLGLKYGDTMPARQLYQLLYARIPSTRDICGYGDGQARSPEWSVCGSVQRDDAYQRARAAQLGIQG
jgi:hypothetical protein